jgi:1,4-dihydroxy-2-naphthoate octaprenyltransferase
LAATRGARPSPLRVWLRAVRPFSFPASVVPVTVGAACAATLGPVSINRFLLTLLGAVALHAGTNLVNDFYDWRQGADHAGSLGPSRVIQNGWISPQTVLQAGLLCFAVGSVAGLILAAQVGPSILLLGLVGVPLAYGYTAPPLKLAYRGAGEPLVFLLMGPLMVLGGFLVQTPPTAGLATPLAASVPVGCLVAAILQANNVRDLDDDRRLGKRTLAALLGPYWARREYDALVGGAYLATTMAAALRFLPWTALLALGSLPLALGVRTLVAKTTDPARLVPAVRRTALLHLIFGVLLAAGIIAGAWVPR